MNEVVQGRGSFRLSGWLPPVGWMGAIFFFSTDYFSARRTGGLLAGIIRFIAPHLDAQTFDEIHFLIRKLGHFTVYAVLAFLVIRALSAGTAVAWKRQWALYALLVVGIYALLDEFHQSFTAERTASIFDSLIDFCGGSFTVLVAWLVRRKRV